jgi:O-antigen/teichoic acid export membrane protein
MAIHLAAGVLQFRWVFDEAPALRLSWRLVNRRDAAGLLSFGGAILAVTICSLIIEQTDRLVIAAFLPVAMVTYYAAAWKIYMLSFTLTTTLVQAVSPVAADLYGRNDYGGLRHLFLQSAKYSAAVAWPLVFCLALSGGFLLRVWMGARFVSALPVVQVLLVGFLVTAHNHAGYSVLIGMRRVAPTVGRYFAPQAILNLALSVWLVQRLGTVGVAVGTMVPAIGLEYFFLRFVLAELRLTWSEFFRRAVVGVAVPALVAYLPLIGAYVTSEPNSPVLPAVATGCSFLYAALFWWFLDPDERAQLIGHVPVTWRDRARTILLPNTLPARADDQL